MKKIIFFILTVCTVGLTASCSSSDDNSTPTNPVEKIEKVGTQTEGNFTYNLYLKKGRLASEMTLPFVVEIIDNTNPTNTNFTNPSWIPTMHMTMSNGMPMTHSTPSTPLQAMAGSTNKFEGEIMFTMAGKEPNLNYWTVQITTNNNGTQNQGTITVLVDDFDNTKDLKTLDFFRIGDPKKGDLYWIAMHQIKEVKVGKNAIRVSIFKKEDNGNSFPVADGFTVEIDPRMPDMGNHGVGQIIAPLRQTTTGGTYDGLITFSMKGYWYINLLVKDQNGEVVAGQFIEADSQVNSDKYFEVEF